jgi:RNA methyltransferase, TrmH family
MTQWTNPQSTRVKALRRLAERSGRRAAGRFIAEGPQAVREALDPRSPRAGQLLATRWAAQNFPAELELARLAGIELVIIADSVAAALADTRQSPGLFAVCELIDQPLPVVVERACAQPMPRIAIFAQMRDPGNAGTVLRAADATGAGGVILTHGSVDVHNAKCVRSTAGSLFHLPIAQDVELAEAIDAVKARGLTVLAADVTGECDLDDLLDQADVEPNSLLTRPTAWIFGNEAWGLSAAELKQADAVVRVPLHGRAESLNLAMAAVVCLHSSARFHTRVARRDARSRGHSR